LIIGYLPLTLNNFILFTSPVTCAASCIHCAGNYASILVIHKLLLYSRIASFLNVGHQLEKVLVR